MFLQWHIFTGRAFTLSCYKRLIFGLGAHLCKSTGRSCNYFKACNGTKYCFLRQWNWWVVFSLSVLIYYRTLLSSGQFSSWLNVNHLVFMCLYDHCDEYSLLNSSLLCVRVSCLWKSLQIEKSRGIILSSHWTTFPQSFHTLLLVCILCVSYFFFICSPIFSTFIKHVWQLPDNFCCIIHQCHTFNHTSWPGVLVIENSDSHLPGLESWQGCFASFHLYRLRVCVSCLAFLLKVWLCASICSAL